MISVSKINNSLLQIESEDDIAMELSQHFTEYAENWKFHPLVKQRRWDGKIRFYNYRTRTLPVGLLAELGAFCAARKYPMHLSQEVKDMFRNDVDREAFVEAFKKIPMSAYGEEIEVRDYQMLGVFDAIKSKRRLFSANTSSGKSLIQYGIIRFLQDFSDQRILLLVPSISLVEQMYSDFRDYATDDENWFVEDNCARLYADYDYDSSKQVLISTWQSVSSLMKNDPEFMDQFFGVLCDEVHEAKAKVISDIMQHAVNAEYRLGFTGTIPKERVNQLTIIGHFGPVRVLQTTRQAMEKGYVSKLIINCLCLKYDSVTSRLFKGKKYQDEMDMLCNLESRNRFIAKTAASLDGNTLILTARVEHGKELVRLLKEVMPADKVHYLFGEVKDRESIRHLLEKSNGNVVVGNYQLLSRGWSVRNLHNLIFGFPSKSFTRVVQSIGRSLRKHDTKDIAKLFDVADNFNEANTSWAHFLERTNIYAEEGLDYKVMEIIFDGQK